MSRKTKVILGISLAVILLALISMVGNAGNFPPPPEDNSCCLNGWWELWHIPNSKYCNGGDYFIWQCVNTDETDVIYTTVCISSVSLDEISVYLPVIIK